MHVFILGATGLIGKRLVHQLVKRGDRVSVLTRSPKKANERLGSAVTVVEGDPNRPGPWQQTLSEVDAVVNLAGEPVADRAWTASQKALIRDSRLLSTRHVVEGMKAAAKKPSVLVQGVAVGIYGDRGDEVLSEKAPPLSPPDFLSQLCEEWEAEALHARDAGVRVVLVRTGVVLDKSGGALEKMLIPFKMFVGGPLGDGRQWFPWIHVEDQVGLMLYALDQGTVSGAVNAVAPNSVTMGEFSQTLGRVLHRPSLMAAPRFALKLAMGERAEVMLASQRVRPDRIQELGYRFQYPQLEAALRSVLAG